MSTFSTRDLGSAWRPRVLSKPPLLHSLAVARCSPRQALAECHLRLTHGFLISATRPPAAFIAVVITTAAIEYALWPLSTLLAVS